MIPTAKQLRALVLLALVCICNASREEAAHVQVHEQQQSSVHFVAPDLVDGTPLDESCKGNNGAKRWQIVAVGLGDDIERLPNNFRSLAFEHWLESTLIHANEEGIGSVDVVLISPLNVDPVDFCGEVTKMRYLTAMHYAGGWTGVMKSAERSALQLRCVKRRLPTGLHSDSETSFDEATIPDLSDKTVGDLLSMQELQEQSDRRLASFHAVLSASTDALQVQLTGFTSLWSLIRSALPQGTEERAEKLVQSLAQSSWNSLCTGGRLFFYNEWLRSTANPSTTSDHFTSPLQRKHQTVKGAHFEIGNAYLANMLVALNHRFLSSVHYIVGIPTDSGRKAYRYSLDLSTPVRDFLQEQPHAVSWEEDAGSVMGPGKWVMTPFRESIKPFESQGVALALWFMKVNEASLELQKPRTPKKVVSPIDFYDWACGASGKVCMTLLKTASPSCVDYWNWAKSLLALENVSSFVQQSKLQDFRTNPQGKLLPQTEFIKSTGITLQIIWHLLQMKLKSTEQGSATVNPARVSLEADSDPCSE